MKRPTGQADSASRILDAAQALIQKNGYNGFSYDDLTQIVNLKKPSIHYHFPTKATLGTAVAKRYVENFRDSLTAIDIQHDSTTARLQAYVALFCTTYGQSKRLCPCGMLGAEADTLPDEVRFEVKRFFELNLGWLATTLEEGRAALDLSFHPSAKTQALCFFSTMEGSMVIGRGLATEHVVAEVGECVVNSMLTQPQQTIQQ